MEDKREITLEEMDVVSGGVNRTVNTGTGDKAAIRKGPGKGFGHSVKHIKGRHDAHEVDDHGRQYGAVRLRNEQTAQKAGKQEEA